MLMAIEDMTMGAADPLSSFGGARVVLPPAGELHRLFPSPGFKHHLSPNTGSMNSLHLKHKLKHLSDQDRVKDGSARPILSSLLASASA